MNALTKICKDVVEKVDDGLSVAVVDLDSGLLLGLHNRVAYLSEGYLNAVAAAAVDMFRGRTVRVVEEMLAQHRGVEPQSLIQEVQMTTPGTFHFMIVLPDKPGILAVLITGRRANLGMGWAVLRTHLAAISQECP